jgi:hypothetical protein
MNWTSIPTMTVCQLIADRLREVAQNPKMNTAKPKREMTRLTRVLSWLSSLAIEPTMITAMVSRAPAGIRIFSGMSSANRTPVFFQTQCMGFVTIVMGTWHVISLIIIASQNKNGITQFLSLRWTTTDATHHLILSVQTARTA